jgi:predicted AlkP superfamily phosphohydrolase/phosphomutase
LDSSSRKVFIVSLDGATFDVFRPLMQLMACGWDAPGVEQDFAFPSELREEIPSAIADYRSTHGVWLSKHVSIDTDAPFSHFLEQQIRGFENEVKLASHFPDTQDRDVFMTHFQRTDWLQHCYEDSSNGASQGMQMDYSARETELIQERLKGLGYLE